MYVTEQRVCLNKMHVTLHQGSVHCVLVIMHLAQCRRLHSVLWCQILMRGWWSCCLHNIIADSSFCLCAFQLLLLENVRFYKEEEKNDAEFAKKVGITPQAAAATIMHTHPAAVTH